MAEYVSYTVGHYHPGQAENLDKNIRIHHECEGGIGLLQNTGNFSVRKYCKYCGSTVGCSEKTGESVETAIRTFMFGCLFSIFHHAIKNVSLIEHSMITDT